MSDERCFNLMALNAELRTQLADMRELCTKQAGLIGQARQQVREAENDLARVRGDFELSPRVLGATLHKLPVGMDATLLMETKAGCQPSVFLGGYWCDLSDLLTAINSVEVEA